MYCPKCGHIVADNAEFCSNCGNRIGKKSASQSQIQNMYSYCPKCGQKLPANASFCPKCGKSIKQTRTSGLKESGMNFSVPVKNPNIRNHNGNIPQKPRKKLIIMIGVIAAIVLIALASTVFFNEVKKKKTCQEGIENLVDVYNTTYSFKDSDNVNLNNLKKIINGSLPQSIAGYTNDALDATVDLYATMYDESQEEAASRMFSSDDVPKSLDALTVGPIQFEKVNSASRLKKDELESYQAEIREDWTSIFSDTELSDSGVTGYNMINDSINKLIRALINLNSEFSSLEVTDGYTVTFTSSWDGKNEKETVDILYIDGSWVSADGLIGFEKEFGKSYNNAYHTGIGY